MVILSMSKGSFNSFSYRSLGDSANRLIDRIVAERPDLAGETFVSTGAGNSSVTVMTQSDVYKAVKPGASMRNFLREGTVLEHLEGRLSGEVTVPRMTWQSPDKTIYAMERVAGQPLSEALLLRLPEEERLTIAESIGRFNADLATTILPQERKAMGLESFDEADRFYPAPLRDKVENEGLLKIMGYRAPTAKRLLDYFERHFDEAEADRRMIFVHPDLHNDNVFYCPETRQLSAIDIGCGNLQRVELMFCVLDHFFPEPFVDRALQSFNTASGMAVTRQDMDIYLALTIMNKPPSDMTDWQDFMQKIDKAGKALDIIEGGQVNQPPSSQWTRQRFVPNMR